MGNYVKENNVKVKDGTDVDSIMRDMMSIILEGALEQELDEEFWVIQSMIIETKKLTISETDILRKPCIQAMGIWKLISHEIVMGNSNRRLSKNTRMQSHRTWRKRLSLCMQKE